MSEPKNQHWLPQFYLRRFAIPGFADRQKAKIWVQDNHTGVTRWSKIRDIAAAKFLYSHVRQDGTHCFRVEKQLAELENIIAQLYPRVADGFPNLEEAWGIKKFMALFIASLVLRHPEMENQTVSLHGQLVQLYEKFEKDGAGLPRITHILRDGKAYPFDTSNYKEYKAADANRLKQIFSEQIAPVALKLTETLFNKRWVFFCVNEPAFFTSDRPVVKIHCEKRTFGLGTPGSHIYFPITPTRMLWLSDRADGEVDGFYPLPIEEVVALNFLTFGNATRFFVSHIHPNPQFTQVEHFINEMYERYRPSRPLEGSIRTLLH